MILSSRPNGQFGIRGLWHGNRFCRGIFFWALWSTVGRLFFGFTLPIVSVIWELSLLRQNLQAKTKKFEDESRNLAHESEDKLKPHERFAIAFIFIQISNALAAITVLTKRKWLVSGALGSAVIGVCCYWGLLLLEFFLCLWYFCRFSYKTVPALSDEKPTYFLVSMEVVRRNWQVT